MNEQGNDILSPHQTVGAIVVAAGGSRRMQGVDKIFHRLRGRPIISYSLETLNSSNAIDTIVLVVSSENLKQSVALVEGSGWSKIVVCEGGQRRQDSVSRGLEHLTGSHWVIVHDGARPFITFEMINDALIAATSTGAAVAAVPVKDTIKTVGADMVIKGTPQRDELWAAQTPQIFRRELLSEAHSKVHDEVTDDAEMIERIGGSVRVFQGSYNNIKITTPEDLSFAEAILQSMIPERNFTH